MAVQELERGTISMLMQQLVTPLAGALEDQLRARAASTCLPGDPGNCRLDPRLPWPA